ncbi:3-isopropylmalate dehydratase small subunit [Hyphomonas polymorpha PS728]|uniref:3-isopropylmalate dehydratase small subunit n=1 Tax=Hyphomonas polymorpha PS728 TaxID=1280954 RepID=A0A062V7P4_9PROT|nr:MULTISPECIES: 3-isopropylmalate dehydratase small subunit [Hyphomonas]AXE63667.1 3-isopropylmalate dehydratase small subunit [Hyphomonas sp. CACIAM 19H1]KCZ98157.1 3-isopropylmalate dehydratase small subunit [Hyphomonas polymorpha PS728]
MPTPFRHHRGVAAPLPVDNVDTDQIIPSREMKTVSRDGLGEGLFAGWRYTVPGGREPVGDFVLNRPEQAGTSILVSGTNFGCGSSREHAVWALMDYGVRAVIAKSFGEIFHGNCLRNGILPVALPEGEVDRLLKLDGGAEIAIDLEAQTVTAAALPGWTGRFEIGAYAKRLLLEGLDPIGLTLLQAPAIRAYQQADAGRRPWVYTAG